MPIVRLLVKYRAKVFLNFVLLLFTGTNMACTTTFFSTWRFPVKSDYKGDWLVYEKQIKVPFHVESDFNGDDLTDNAWILFSRDKSEWGLFVFLSRKSGGQIIHELARYSNASIIPQSMGISLAQSGRYETVCSKDHSDCDSSDAIIFDLQFSGINFFTYESASSMFYWNDQIAKFENVWLND
jgi:hypothetical protein